MDDKSKEIEQLKMSLEYYTRLLRENKKGEDEDYSCRDVARRIVWHEERMRCIKALKGEVV